MNKYVKLGVEVNGLDKATEQLNQAEQAAEGLRKQFIEAKKEVDRLAGSGVIDQSALDEAISRMADLKDRMSDVNEQVNVFASGSKYEQVSNAFGEIGAGIANLDFGKANERAQAFAKAASSISFGDAISSVKDLGSTFVTLGKSLLTNPLFLLGAVIIGIVMAIKQVLDELGIMKKITEAVGQVFDWLMGLIKQAVTALTDFFGITNEKERELTGSLQQQAVQYEKNAKAIQEKNDISIQGLDYEIKMAKLSGKNTEELEKKKQSLLKETAKAHYEAAVAAINAARQSGKATDEEIAKLKEKLNVTKAAYFQSVYDEKIADAERQAARREADKKEKEEQAKKNKEASDKRKQANDKKKQEEKQYNQDRLNTTRQIEDLTLANMSAGIEKEIALNNAKYKRLIEDTLRNEKLLQSEKDAIVKGLEAQKIANESALREVDKTTKDQKLKDEKDRLQKSLDLKNEYKLKELESGDVVDPAKQLEADNLRAQMEMDAEKARLEEALADKLLTEEEFRALNLQLDAEYRDKLTENAKNQAEREKALQEQKFNKIKDITMTTLSGIANVTALFGDKNKKAAKAAFNIQKGMQIANATIDTFKAANSAYSSLAPIPIVGPALGAVAAAGAVASGIMNVKKIMATKFDEGGGGSAPGASAAPEAPNLSAPIPPSLFGPEQVGAEGGNTEQMGERQGGTVIKAYVVESEMTSTQNRISNLQQRSEIG